MYYGLLHELSLTGEVIEAEKKHSGAQERSQEQKSAPRSKKSAPRSTWAEHFSGALFFTQ